MNKENGKIEELMGAYNNIDDNMSVWGAVALGIGILYFSYNEIFKNNLEKNAKIEKK